MGYIKVENLAATFTPEQVIFVQAFYNKFDIDSLVAHKKILNVEPLFYMGAITGSEFLTYAANKLYLCLSLMLDTPEPENDTDPVVSLFDESNTLFFNLERTTIGVLAAVLTDHGQTMEITNLYFSRLLPSVAAPYKNMKFIGYRITLT